jgi:hypothetical protein
MYHIKIKTEHKEFCFDINGDTGRAHLFLMLMDLLADTLTTEEQSNFTVSVIKDK